MHSTFNSLHSQSPKAGAGLSGSPSGHAMVTAAVWWVVVSSLGSYLYSRTHRYNFLNMLFLVKEAGGYQSYLKESLFFCAPSMVLSAAPYLLYVVLLVAVGISRIFILAHFPHQVVAGSITGLNTF